MDAKAEQHVAFLCGEVVALDHASTLLHIEANNTKKDPRRVPFLQLSYTLIEAELEKRRCELWAVLNKSYMPQTVPAHTDTGGPDQGGEFHRGDPGHPDNEMGM